MVAVAVAAIGGRREWRVGVAERARGRVCCGRRHLVERFEEVGFGLLGSPHRLLHRLAHLTLKPARYSPDLVDGSADLPGGIGQLVRPQDEKGNEEDDEQFAAAEISHASMLPTSVRVLGPRLRAPTQAQTGIVDLRKRTFTEPIGRAHEVIGGDGRGGRPAQ
jgi:hypothetical protein